MITAVVDYDLTPGREQRAWLLDGPDDVETFVAGLSGEEGVTVVLSAASAAADLMLGISGRLAFAVAAVPDVAAPDAFYHWIATPDAPGDVEILAGGVEGPMEARLLLDIGAAASLARRWAAGDADPPGAQWEPA